jgi:DNA-binding response OmpR family regulator
MADTAHTLGAAGRPTTPSELLRQINPYQPVLLVGPDEIWDSTGVAACLEAAGWSSANACDPERASWLASIQKVSLVLVAGDSTLLWATVVAVRPVTMAPLVVLADVSPADVVALVGAGVDAVVDPATGADEVFARVVALLRRSEHGWGPGVRYLHSGGLRVDLWSQECFLDGELLQLSPTEYALLTFLMTHSGQALPTHTIVREVWGWFTSDGKNVLRIFVNRLRRKLHDDFRNPQFIASVRGTGYRFIRNVAEIGDGPDPTVERSDVTLLLQSVEHLAVGLRDRATVDSAGEYFLDVLDDTGYADGMALFRVDGNRMQLVVARNMPPSWMASVKNGVPLKPAFASAQSVLTREAVQFGDVRQVARHFSATAQQLGTAGYGACLFLPVLCGDQVWGHLGLVRRARQSFDPTGTSYLRAACAVFALAIDDMDRTSSPA